MNIHEISEKIKGLLRGEAIWHISLILLVGIACLGVGYLSALPDNKNDTSVNIVAPDGTQITCSQEPKSQ